jgi:hypothetical protein
MDMTNLPRGGNIILQAQAGAPGCRDPGGSFIFMLGNTEYMRINPDGNVYVRGNIVGNDRKVYENFREWLNCATSAMQGSDIRIGGLATPVA